MSGDFSIPANLVSGELFATKGNQNGFTSQATFTVKAGLAQNLKVWLTYRDIFFFFLKLADLARSNYREESLWTWLMPNKLGLLRKPVHVLSWH